MKEKTKTPELHYYRVIRSGPGLMQLETVTVQDSKVTNVEHGEATSPMIVLDNLKKLATKPYFGIDE